MLHRIHVHVSHHLIKLIRIGARNKYLECLHKFSSTSTECWSVLYFRKQSHANSIEFTPVLVLKKDHSNIKYQVSTCTIKCNFLSTTFIFKLLCSDGLEFMSRAIIFHSIENPTLDCQTWSTPLTQLVPEIFWYLNPKNLPVWNAMLPICVNLSSHDI